MNYANQKRINFIDKIIIQHKPQSSEKFLAPTDWKYIIQAKKDLTDSGFTVWLYFLSWYGKDYVFFSPAAINEEFGISIKSAQRGLQELLNKNYCRQDEINTYTFSPIPITE